ncbi:MAG: hypothetical protein Q4B78_02895, partial [Bacillota bacterium]|nr:hypothetical protein [Bacillota bacterium]
MNTKSVNRSKILVWLMTLVMALTVFSVPVSAVEQGTTDKKTDETIYKQENSTLIEEDRADKEAMNESPEGNEASDDSVTEDKSEESEELRAQEASITGTFPIENGKDIAT